MACYARPEEKWRFFEIDPVVADLARDPRRFRFLSACRPDAEIVLGDARLTLAREPDGGFDYLVIDAFSSDSVPVHLMTVEAMQLYLAKLAPDGIIALHVSNRHMDLVAVASALGRALPGLATAVIEDRQEASGYDAASSHVVMAARSEAALAPVMALAGARPVAADLPAAWTDDFSNVLGAIWRKYRQR